MAGKKITPIIYIILSVFVFSNVGIAGGLLAEQLETQTIAAELEGNVEAPDSKAGNKKTTKSKPEEQEAGNTEEQQGQTLETVASHDTKKEKLISHIKKILDDYPSYIEITDSRIFKDYVNNLPLPQFRNAKRVIGSGTTKEAVKLITDHKKQRDYQKKHIELMTTLVNNYTGMDRQRHAEKTIQDWIRKEEKNSVVSNLRIRKTNIKTYTFGTYLYIVCYTTAKDSSEKEHSFLVDISTNSVRSIWLDRKTRKNYHL